MHNLETLGQQNGAPVPDAAVGLAAAMPNTPEEEDQILRFTQRINVCHAAAKPQNTVQAERSQALEGRHRMASNYVLHGALDAFKAQVTHTHPILQRYCEQEAYSDGDLMSHAKILEFWEWLVGEAVQQNGARYSFSSVR